LVKDASQRLGCRADGGVAQLKAHPFLASVNWVAVAKKKVRPPLKPKVRNASQ